MMNLKKSFVRAITFFLTVALVFSCGMISFAHAAACPTQNIIAYPKEAGRRDIPAYADQGCTQRIGLVYGTDKCTIINVYGDVLLLDYPAGNRTRRAYVKTSDFTSGNFVYAQEAVASENITVFSHETGNSKLGTIFKDDPAYIIYSGANRSQIIYGIGNSSSWKMGWIDFTTNQESNQNSEWKTVAVPDGYYYIATSIDSSRVADVWGARMENGTNFQLYRKGDNSMNQRYHISHVSNGWYKITCALNENMCVELYGGRVTGTEHNISIWEYHAGDGNGDGQLWRFHQCSDGSYIIENKLGLVMDLARSSLSDESNIVLCTLHGAPNQRWLLVKTSAANSSPEVSSRQLAMANKALEYLGSRSFNGYCQRFVRIVSEESLGLESGNAASALDAYGKWCVSSSMDSIPVGAAVYLRAKNHSSAGYTYGHVGIYVGDGYVVHAVSTVKKQSLSEMLNSYSYLGWGWQSGTDLR